MKISHKGNWWISSDPELRITGELTIEGSTIELSLDDHFSRVDNEFLAVINDRVIQGTSREGKELTLVQCYEIHRGAGTTFKITKVIEGAHLTSTSRFEECNAYFPSLLNWIGIPTFKSKYQQISFEPELKEIEFPFIDGTKRKIAVNVNINSLDNRVMMESYAGLVIEKPTGLTLDEALNELETFKQFLTLNCVQEVSFSRLRLRISKEDKSALSVYVSMNQNQTKKGNKFHFLLH